MRFLNIPTDLEPWLEKDPWIEIEPLGQGIRLKTRAGIKANIYRIDAGEVESAPAGNAELALYYSKPPDFRGGLVWIYDVSGGQPPEILVLEQCLKWMNVSADLQSSAPRNGLSRIAFEFSETEYTAVHTLLTLCIAFGWGCYVVPIGMRIMINTNYENFLTITVDDYAPHSKEFDALLGEMEFTKLPE